MKTHQSLLTIIFLFIMLSCQVEEKEISLHLVGDSTMADKQLFPNTPERGWGQLFPLYVNDELRIKKYAVNGRSSKSFRDEGKWRDVINNVNEGDFVLIQFGHNDQKEQDSSRYAEANTDYKENLRAFVNEVIAQKATPILATSIARRQFDESNQLIDTHGDYPQAVRQLGLELNIPVIDLHKSSSEIISKLGFEASKTMFLHFEAGVFDKFPDGVNDDTHLSATGASIICDQVVLEIQVKVPTLATYLQLSRK
jgi:lysophospholipase L1-like esterase